MIDQKISKLNSWFEEKIALCGKRNQELNGDGRTDEAIFEKIKANIYDVFRTVLSVAVKPARKTQMQLKPFLSREQSRSRQAGLLPWKKPESIMTPSECRRSRSSLTQFRKSGKSFQRYGRERNDGDRGYSSFQMPV